MTYQPLWTAAEAMAATGGTTSLGWQATGVSIDTRSLQKGDLFVALEDVRDGHDFVANAFKAGASAALVSRDVPDAGGPLLVTKNVLPALEALGLAARERCAGACMAVTGSVGKTSVKEMLAQIFRAAGPAHWSVKSFNNHWGVPLTLARMPQDTQRAIFEIGMSTPGEIAPRSKMVRPHCVIVTKIAGVHLEGLGTVAGVAEEKAGIFAGLQAGGIAVLPAEDDFLGLLSQRAKEAVSDVDILTFGTSSNAHARVLSYEVDGHAAIARLDILGRKVAVKLEAGGAHWALNAGAALLASVTSGQLTAEDASEALSGFTPPQGRGQIETLHLPGGGQAVMVDDSYNANPASMRAALEALAARPAKRRLVALGEMGELGRDAARYHRELLGPVEASGAEIAFLGGPGMAPLAAVLPSKIGQHFEMRPEALLNLVKDTLCEGDTLLIKGSNSSGMVGLAEMLRQWSAATDQQVMKGSAQDAARGL